MPNISNDAYNKYLENKGQSGYRAAILVSETGDVEGGYSLLVASESVPSIFGSSDSFEFDLLNSPVKGKIAGKMTLEDKEVEVLHHRDNVYRFEKLKDKTLNFMVIDSQFVGYKFVGTIAYRMNDATADVLRGTYTITPMSADPVPILDARPFCKETLCFASVVPDDINAGKTITLSVVQTNANETYTAKKIASDGTETDATTVIIDKVFTAPDEGGLYAITASATNYAPWTTTVYVNPKTT
jgi:hypothetical protein